MMLNKIIEYIICYCRYFPLVPYFVLNQNCSINIFTTILVIFGPYKLVLMQAR
jgi:hypothetical protein